MLNVPAGKDGWQTFAYLETDGVLCLCRLRRQWSDRRYKTTVVLMAETISQIINLIVFILPNAYVLARPCGWRDPIVLWCNFVSFSCWNTLFLVLVVRICPAPRTADHHLA